VAAFETEHRVLNREGGAGVGTLFYGSPSLELQFDDWTLSHLQVVIGSKLRRGESFFFSWAKVTDGDGEEAVDEQRAGDARTIEEGKSTVWLSPGVPLMFTYSVGQAPNLNMTWLHRLAEAANSGRGLVLLPEPIESDERNAARTRAGA
jgi:hypothetical protein